MKEELSSIQRMVESMTAIELNTYASITDPVEAQKYLDKLIQKAKDDSNPALKDPDYRKPSRKDFRAAERAAKKVVKMQRKIIKK